LGGASGALAPGADFEGALKRLSPTGHMLIRSTVAWRFPHFKTKRVVNDFFFNLAVSALAYSDVFWCLHMYIYIMLFVYCCKYCWFAILDIKTRDVPTVSSINSLLSQYCKALHCFGAPTVRFAPVVPWTKTSPVHRQYILGSFLHFRNILRDVY
jgi:hypothetical protein